MGRNCKKIVSIAMLTLAIVIVTSQCIYSNASDLKATFIPADSSGLSIETITVPEEAKEYANQSVGMLLADVYGNEDGFGVDITDYSELTLGEPYTVISQSSEQIYSFPLMNDGEIIMIMSVFKADDGKWNASLGKDYAEELNKLKSKSDESYVLYVEDGGIYAQNDEKKMLIEEANYDYDANNDTDFDEGTSYDKIIDTAKKHGGNKIDKVEATDEIMSSTQIQEQMAQYSYNYEQYYETWRQWAESWFRRWRPSPTRPAQTQAPVTPVVTNAPSVAPVVSETPVTPVEPVVTVYPDNTNAPVVTNAPVLTRKPAVTQAPAVVTNAPSSGNGVGAYASNPFSIDTDTAKTLNTKSCAVNQQDKNGTERGLCWAATSATIINYMNGRSDMRGYAIADQMGIGYDRGGSLQDIQSALSKYNISAKTSNSQLSMDAVVTNINNKKPMAMCAYASAGGHAVSIVGYSKDGNQTITIWNSGNQQMQTCTYQSSGTSFTYAGYKFSWYATVYPQ